MALMVRVRTNRSPASLVTASRKGMARAGLWALNAGGSTSGDSPGFNLGFELRPHQLRKLAATPEPVARFVRTRTMRAAGSGVAASVP